MKNKNQDIGKRIEYALQYSRVKKLSALALELGVDDSAISRWRTNGNISIKNAGNLCSALDISLDWVVLGRGSIHQHKNFYANDTEQEIIFLLRQLEPETAVLIINLIRKLYPHLRH